MFTINYSYDSRIEWLDLLEIAQVWNSMQEGFQYFYEHTNQIRLFFLLAYPSSVFQLPLPAFHSTSLFLTRIADDYRSCFPSPVITSFALLHKDRLKRGIDSARNRKFPPWSARPRIVDLLPSHTFTQ